MNNIYQHYIIDLSSNNNFVQIPTVQGDGNNIRGFEVELIENSIPYVIDKNDCITCIMGTKPDTRQIMNDCEVSDEGYILVDITSQMSAVKGRGDYQIVLMSKSTNCQLKSFPFHILTTPATFDIDYIISTDEFQLLTKNVAQTVNVIESANNAISDIRELEVSVETAENIRIESEKARVNAENTRDATESDRIRAEDIRTASEDFRKSEETIRQANEKVRIENELARKDNETVRQANEENRKAAETDRDTAESGRLSAENIRIENENIRIENENQRKVAETAREVSESNRAEAEEVRVSNEAKRMENETIREQNETSRQTNITTAITNAENATERALKAAKDCEDLASGTGMIMQSEKGAANGVATLDENKKLTNSQLPIATSSEIGGIKIGNNITANDGIISVLKKNVTDALGFIPIEQTDTTTELLSSTEPTESQNVGDFWLQEY